jgi:hypothetical protein
VRTTRRSLGALVATLVLGVGVGSAAAEEYWVIGQSFRVAMRALTVHSDVIEATAVCPVTLEGTFSSASFTAAARTRIGSVTRAGLGACTGGTASILSASLPWTLQYDTFGGTLPEPTSVSTRIIGAGIAATLGGISCLASTEEAEPLKLRFLRNPPGELSEASFDESSRIRPRGAFCELSKGYLSGSGTNRLLGTTAEESVFYVNHVATALRIPGGGAIPVIGLLMGGQATITLINGWRGEDLTLTALPVSLDTGKFIIENTGTTCRNGTNTLLRNAGNSCNVRIRRIGGNVGDVVEVEMRYRSTESFPLEPIAQNFRVRAN